MAQIHMDVPDHQVARVHVVNKYPSMFPLWPHWLSEIPMIYIHPVDGERKYLPPNL